ncbi:MAG: beta-lactamase family protein [Pseudomonadota bacterium]|nr:beta-lactamase family protein [Pseudomonadota bacterium]
MGHSGGFDRARLKRIAPAMQAYVDRGVYAGVDMLIARGGDIAYRETLGFADREAKAALKPDAIHRLYSMTKPVVCTALMTLVEEGKLRLIDPVAKYIPAFGATKVLRPDGALEPQKRPMLVRDLMTHTSGLTYGFLEDSPVSRDYPRGKLFDPRAPLGEAIEDLASFPLAFQPGERFHYSVGIDVAARLIEIVSGQSLGAVLRERILAPLKMHDTDFVVPEGKRARLAAMYGRPDIIAPGVTTRTALEQWRAGYNERIDVSRTYPVDAPGLFERGGHGLFGTTGDYFRFAQMLCNGGELDGVRVIGRKTLELMHSNHLPSSMLPIEIGGLPLMGYGFGLGSRVLLDVAASGAPGSVGEFGWSGAAKTHYWVDPREQVVALFMTQSMLSFDLPELDLRALVYQALD